ncbi:MAG: 30S ribosomal protein S16 [Saprospiraceae bacterium]|nr:30S ribosomal protein S16 [Saprospiraceae bacterium]
MAVKIRLARRGRKKNPYYHIVVADARSPRDGKYIENIGSYNPLTVPATIELDREKAYEWLNKGAVPTDTVNAILRFKGVLLKKHLMKGVKKGALTQEQAEIKLADWIETKEARIQSRIDKTKSEKEQHHKLVSGEMKAPVKVAASEEDQAAFREEPQVEVPQVELPTAEEPKGEEPKGEEPKGEETQGEGEE